MTRQEAIAKYGSTYRRYDFPTCSSPKGCCMMGSKNGKHICILWENDGCEYRNENEIIK